jgi:hypothetical protein
MSILNPTKRSFERGSDDFIKQPEAEADHRLTMDKSDVEAPADTAFSRKTLRKVDLHVLPILAVLYSFAVIDRINLA